MTKYSGLALTALTAAALAASGCHTFKGIGNDLSDLTSKVSSPLHVEAPTEVVPAFYHTNASRGLQATDFGNDDFDSPVSKARLNGSDPAFTYTFGRISPNVEIKLKDGTVVDPDTVFPYWAVKDTELSEKISEEEETHTLGRHDGLVRIFVENPSIDFLRTDRTFIRNQLPDGVRVGNVPVSQFDIPMVDFDGLQKSPYTLFVDKDSKQKVAFVEKPVYELVADKINYHGKIFTEHLATISNIPIVDFSKSDVVNSEVVYKTITTTPSP
jgi:predicted small secreted protein